MAYSPLSLFPCSALYDFPIVLKSVLAGKLLSVPFFKKTFERTILVFLLGGMHSDPQRNGSEPPGTVALDVCEMPFLFPACGL